MNRRELADTLADNWLASIHPFDRRLYDTGERYNGHPVFMMPLYLNGDHTSIMLYRHTPCDAEYSILEFLPEGV